MAAVAIRIFMQIMEDLRCRISQIITILDRWGRKKFMHRRVVQTDCFRSMENQYIICITDKDETVTYRIRMADLCRHMWSVRVKVHFLISWEPTTAEVNDPYPNHHRCEATHLAIRLEWLRSILMRSPIISKSVKTSSRTKRTSRTSSKCVTNR